MTNPASHKSVQNENMRAAIILSNEACALISQGFNECAIAKLNKALLDLLNVEKDNHSHSSEFNVAACDKYQACCSRSDNHSHYYPDNAFDEGMTTFSQPLQICEVCPDHRHKAAVKATIYFNLGIAHSRIGKEPDAQEYLHKSLSIQQSATAPLTIDVDDDFHRTHSSIGHGPSLCAILHNIGHLYWRCGRHADAVSCYETALDALSDRNSHAECRSLDISSTLNCIAVAKLYANTRQESTPSTRSEKIVDIFTNALALRLAASTVPDREAATISNNTGRARFCTGDYSAALAAYQYAYSLRVATLGETHVDVASSLFNIAQVKEKQGHISEAIDLYKQYLPIVLLHMGEASIRVAEVLHTIGRLSYRTNDLDQAYDFLSRALPASKLAFGRNSRVVAAIMNKIGNVLHAQKKLDLALEAYRSGLAIEQSLYHPSLHKDISVTLMNVANIYRLQGKWDEMLGIYKEAIAIIRHDSDAKATISILLNIGYAYEMKGKFDLASDVLEAVVNFYRGLRNDYANVGVGGMSIGIIGGGDQDDDDDVDLFFLASSLNNLGLVQSKAGSLHLALASFLEALDLLRSSGRTHTDYFMSACLNAAITSEELGDTDRALRLYKHMLHLEQTKCRDNDNDYREQGRHARPPPNLKKTALLSHRIGLLLREREDLEGALHYLDLSSKVILENPAVIDEDSTCEIFRCLGDLYVQMGDRGKAVGSYVEGIYAILRKTNPPPAAAA